jgi:1-aminocyclopropane-1-carboxylate deaminase/D-cysteine desulfhydrase-like pyridoxal-dependent ACC family enzyme
MQFPEVNNITIDDARAILPKNKKMQLHMLRLDKIHPIISGNKWFKLKYHLENFHKGGYKGIVTFGGAWSNHIVATACACYQQGISCVGIIRGEKPDQPSATLQEAEYYKMKLKFISRNEFRNKTKTGIPEEIANEFGGYYFIPEGGSGDEGEKGAQEILQLVPENNYTHIACAVGTGTMFKGLQNALLPGQKLIGVSALKGWHEKINNQDSIIFSEYHFGGYAKYDETLLKFINDFYKSTDIPLDFVYTGKLAFAVADLLKKDFFPDESNILMIHSGGLQGNASLEKGSLIF